MMKRNSNKTKKRVSKYFDHAWSSAKNMSSRIKSYKAWDLLDKGRAFKKISTVTVFSKCAHTFCLIKITEIIYFERTTWYFDNCIKVLTQQTKGFNSNNKLMAGAIANFWNILLSARLFQQII